MTTNTHNCGGSILTDGAGDQIHSYCGRCGAYVYHYGAGVVDLPAGTDVAANRAAYDAGDDRSPGSQYTNKNTGKLQRC